VNLFPAGTLLVAMYGEGKTRGTVGELAIAATTNQACAAVQLTDPDPRHRAWTRLALEANYWSMRRLVSGGVQPNLNLNLVRQIVVPFPKDETLSCGAATHTSTLGFGSRRNCDRSRSD
jgi:type I restriction enzyme S subunit